MRQRNSPHPAQNALHPLQLTPHEKEKETEPDAGLLGIVGQGQGHLASSTHPHKRKGVFFRYCLAAAVLGALSGFITTLQYIHWVSTGEAEAEAEAEVKRQDSPWTEAQEMQAEVEHYAGHGEEIGKVEDVGEMGEVGRMRTCTQLEQSRVSGGVILEASPKEGTGMSMGMSVYKYVQGSVDDCYLACRQTVDCGTYTYDSLERKCYLYRTSTAEKLTVIDQGIAWFTAGRCAYAEEGSDGEENNVRIDRHARDASWFSRRSVRRTYRMEYRYKSYTGHWKERKDYKVHVRAALEAANLTEEPRRSERTSTGHEWDILWGLQWKSLKEFKRARLKPDQMINMLPGAARLVVGDKDAFHRTFRKMAERHGEEAVRKFILKSFEVEERWEPSDVADADADVWIVKEFRSWNGAGVKVMSSDDVRKLVESASKSRKKKQPGFIVQQYVLNPLTIRGHKFDTRWWAVVTSVGPLRAYLVPNAYLKIAKASAYDPSHRYLSDACMHITNTQVQTDCGTKLRKGQPFPTSILDPSLASQLGDALGKPLNGFFAIDALVKRTKQVIAESLVMIAPELLSNKRKATEARTFQVFAYDIIYDDIHANAWIEEINTNGYLGGGIGTVDKRRDYLRELFQLVGVNGFNRLEYAGRVERAANDGTSRRQKLSKEDKLLVQDTVDEFAHRGHWDVLFPPMTLEELAPFQSLMTPAEIAQAEIQIWGRQLYTND